MKGDDSDSVREEQPTEYKDGEQYDQTTEEDGSQAGTEGDASGEDQSADSETVELDLSEGAEVEIFGRSH